MDEEFDTSVDTSDVDTSADMDTSDVVDDVPDDIPEDIPEDILEDIPEDEPELTEEDDLPDDIPEDVPEDEPELTEEYDLSEDIPEDVLEDESKLTEENDLSDDIPEDVPEDEPEMTEEDDLSEDIPEDVPEDEPEMTEEDDLPEDIPEVVPADEPELMEKDDLSDDVSEEQEEIDDASSDADGGDSAEPVGDTQDESMDDVATDEVSEKTTSEMEDTDAAEQVAETQDEPLDDTATDEISEETTSETEDTDAAEQVAETQDEPLDDTATDEVSEEATSETEDTDATEQISDTQDEPMDDATADETAEDTTSDVDSGDSDEPTEDVQDKSMDDATADETTENTTSDVNSGDSTESTEDTQDEHLDDTATDETADDNASDVNGSNFGEQNDTLKETADEANEFNDGTQNELSKVLKRDELDLLKSGNNAINQRLEAQADDYRDRGMNEDEIRDRLAVDKWNFQKEFLEDAFPGQDVSPNVFNGLSENGAKDRIADIENSDTLRNQLRSDEADNTLDRESSAHKWDEDELEPEPFKPAIKDVVGEDEYKNYQDIYDTVSNLDVSDTYKDTLVEQLKNMNPELKGLYNDYANDLKCLDTNYPGIANFDRTKGGFVFSETKDVNKGLGAGNTFLHESAHMMDYLTGENGKDLSVTNDLTSAIQEDYNDALSNIMKTHNCSFEDAQSKLSDELWAHPVESNCVSDVFGGLSENKVSGPWGHTTDYWVKRPRSAVGSEAFAEITADSASNPQSLAFTKKYMPKTYSAYQSMIKGARKNG